MNTVKLARQLNALLKIDPEAINKLFTRRASCNKKLADHPVIQVRQGKNGTTSISVVGLINGLLLGQGSKTVLVVHIDDVDGRIVRFSSKAYSSFLK